MNLSLVYPISLPPKKDFLAKTITKENSSMGQVRLLKQDELTIVSLPNVEELPRRTIYTPLNRIVAFDRKVDYVPYFDDGTADTVTKILQKHREKISRRWMMSKYKTERNFVVQVEKWRTFSYTKPSKIQRS